MAVQSENPLAILTLAILTLAILTQSRRGLQHVEDSSEASPQTNVAIIAPRDEPFKG